MTFELASTPSCVIHAINNCNTPAELELGVTLERAISVEEHRDFLEKLMSRYVDAELVLVDSKDEIDGKLGQSRWGPEMRSRISVPKTIAEIDAENILLALAIRGEQKQVPELSEDADSISDARRFLTHLVLHEIAHVKHQWGQDREIDCDVWAHNELVKMDAGDT